jgi:hypothetical protein
MPMQREKWLTLFRGDKLLAWNINWNMVSAIAAWIGAVAIIIGIIIACWQIRELKRSKHVELCTYFCDRFEDLNKDEGIVEFRKYLDNLSFIDKCKKECIYEGTDEIEIPEEISEKILCDYIEKFSDSNPLDNLCNFFEKLGILWKGKYIPIELIDQFFGDSIVFHWIGLYPFTTYRRSEYQRRELFLQFGCLFKKIIKRTQSQRVKRKVLYSGIIALVEKVLSGIQNRGV